MLLPHPVTCIKYAIGWTSMHQIRDHAGPIRIKCLDLVRNILIHEMTNTQPLIDTVKQFQLHFLNGHILAIPGARAGDRALFVPTHAEEDQV